MILKSGTSFTDSRSGYRKASCQSIETRYTEQDRLSQLVRDNLELSKNSPAIQVSHTQKEHQKDFTQDVHKAIQKEVRVFFLGEPGVGKTSMISRIARQSFQLNVPMTVGFHMQYKNMQVDGKKVRFELEDSTGQQIFHSLTLQQFRNADVAILIFDLANSSQRNKIDYWIQEISRNARSSNVIVIGNKSDIKGQMKNSRKQLPILPIQKQKIRQKGWHYIEQFSCKSGEKKDVLIQLLQQLSRKIQKIPCEGFRITKASFMKNSFTDLQDQESQFESKIKLRKETSYSHSHSQSSFAISEAKLYHSKTEKLQLQSYIASIHSKKIPKKQHSLHKEQQVCCTLI